MNSMKNLYILFLIVLATSCSNNFLDRAPISQANESDFYTSANDIEVSMDAAYNSLYTLYGPESLPSFFGELMSDNCYTTNTAGTVSAYFEFQNSDLRADNILIEGYWNNFYTALFRVNNILYQLKDLNFEKKNDYVGQCKFLRALYYFNMVQTWGGVPIVTTPITIAESYAMKRGSEEEVYSQIVSDLQDAAVSLKETPLKLGAATSGAANALLGKVYLTMGNKSKAEETLMKVYNKYSLVPYADLWDMSKKNGKESIFEIQYLGGKSNPYSKYWAMFSPIDNRIVTAWGAGMNQVTDDLWNAYESGDIRRDISIFNGYKQSDGSFNPTRFAKKWVDTKAELDGLREASNNNFIVLRYADVLLMLSEATNNPKYLNEVRSRVGLPHFGSVGYPSDKYPTLDLAIEHERQVEFALEFHRFFDLKRTGRAISVMKQSSKNIDIKPYRLYIPIPLSVIVQNPNVITQNPGY